MHRAPRLVLLTIAPYNKVQSLARPVLNPPVLYKATCCAATQAAVASMVSG